jgi:Fe-S oxidoreductase
MPMTASTTPNNTLEKKVENLSQADLNKILSVFKDKLDSESTAYLHSCVHCGLCLDSCHYYLSDKNMASTPAKKLDLMAKVFKKHFSPGLEKWLPLSGAEKLTRKMVREWVDSLFGRCSLCGRCSLNCTMGINIFSLIRAARGALAAVGLVPSGLKSTIDTALEKGNNMGISKEDWLETILWLEEELKQEVKDPQASLPVDKKGVECLYTINPREAMFFPLSISAAGKIFYSSKESWTFSSENFDVTNYGLYSGDNDTAGRISERLYRSMDHLGCKTMVLAECGHGFNSNRWEAPEWLQQKSDFRIISIIQLIADHIRDGCIRLDPSRNKKITTLHDPCNLVRLGGIIEEQRYVLEQTVLNFVEMTPNRENNFCCGGGGGQLAMTRFAERRIKSGKVKADQIRETGAEVVVAPCHNCIDQLMEIKKHYQLKIEIKTLTEMVADALVLA